MKKLFLILLGVLSALPTIARDIKYTYEGQTLTYYILSKEDRTVMVTSGSRDPAWVYEPVEGISRELKIPSTITDSNGESYAVTKIGEAAFSGCMGLTSITIPDSVTEIDGGAFDGCSGLTSFIIPESVTKIGDSAFSRCTGLTSVTIPNSVTEIDIWTFLDCSNLTSVVIPESVKTIGLGAFSGCAGLTSVTIPNSVTSIERYAFSECINLTSVVIPNSVSSIEDNTFYDCHSLTSVTLPNSVTSIGKSAFRYCSRLTSLVLPPEVETIGEYAFQLCSRIKSITMGSKVSFIGMGAFGNTKPENIYITTPTPPRVSTSVSRVFTDYSANLYLQDDEAIYLYGEHDEWYRFNTFKMTVPTDMKVSSQVITGEIGESFQLNVTLFPEDVTLPYLFYYSTNPEVATVDNNGLVTIVGANNAETRSASEPCKIIATTLYADGPIAEVTIEGKPTGIDPAFPGVTAHPNEIDYSAPYELFTIGGQRLKSDIEDLDAGIYIIRQGTAAKKIAID